MRITANDGQGKAVFADAHRGIGAGPVGWLHCLRRAGWLARATSEARIRHTLPPLPTLTPFLAKAQVDLAFGVKVEKSSKVRTDLAKTRGMEICDEDHIYH
jgi:hypothetical protein